MTRFIYKGSYYPVFGSSNGYEYPKYESRDNGTKIYLSGKDTVHGEAMTMLEDIPKAINSKGEWTAQTLEDCYIMAQQFAGDVS